jgi:hypothetical protein
MVYSQINKSLVYPSQCPKPLIFAVIIPDSLPYIYAMKTLNDLLQYKTAESWASDVQTAITFLITELPPDTFEERAPEIQELLASLEELRRFFNCQPPLLIVNISKN